MTTEKRLDPFVDVVWNHQPGVFFQQSIMTDTVKCLGKVQA
jgi:hypothetical protein